jgi:hypothetical protein
MIYKSAFSLKQSSLNKLNFIKIIQFDNKNLRILRRALIGLKWFDHYILIYLGLIFLNNTIDNYTSTARYENCVDVNNPLIKKTLCN